MLEFMRNRVAVRRVAVGICLTTMAVSGATAPAMAQEDGVGSYPLTAVTAFCDEQTGGPLYGCTAWEGVTVSFEAGGGGAITCETEAAGDGRAAACGFQFDLGSTVTVSIDPASIPDGYVLKDGSAVSQTVTMPEERPDGEWGGVYFLLDRAETAPEQEPELEPTAAPGDEDLPPIRGDEPLDEPAGPSTADAPVTGLPRTGAGLSESDTGRDHALLATTLALTASAAAATVAARRRVARQ